MKNFLIKSALGTVTLLTIDFLTPNTWFHGVFAGMTMMALIVLTDNILNTDCKK